MLRMARLHVAIVAGLALAPCLARADENAVISVEHGRYVAVIGGCNDCHTAGYAPSNGNVPQAQWMQGSAVGFRGPWGTSYPINIRAYLASMSEDAWVARATTMETKPPMPWFTIRQMSEADLRSFYRFVKSLGPVGGAAPEDVPPGVDPKTPFIVFAPPTMPQ